MRYVQIPTTIDIRNFVTDEPTGEKFTFAKSCRLAFASLANKGQTDTYVLHDLRRKIERAEVGSFLELSEDEWKLLEGEFRRPNPQIFVPTWTLSAESHQSAVLDAKKELPAVLSANGKSAEA